MPSGLDADSLALLESANEHDVQVSTVNIMTMNYGESYDGDMGDYAITAAKAAHTQLKKTFGTTDAAAWRGMALTSMIGVNDVDNETFTLADAAEVRTFAEGKGDRVGVDVVDLPRPAVRGRQGRAGRRADRLQRGEAEFGGVRGGVRGLPAGSS